MSHMTHAFKQQQQTKTATMVYIYKPTWSSMSAIKLLFPTYRCYRLPQRLVKSPYKSLKLKRYLRPYCLVRIESVKKDWLVGQIVVFVIIFIGFSSIDTSNTKDNRTATIRYCQKPKHTGKLVANLGFLLVPCQTPNINFQKQRQK